MIKRNLRKFSQKIMRYAKFLFLVSDFIFFNGAYFLALFIRFGTFNFPFQEGYLKLLLIGNILWLILIGTFNTHRVFRFEPIEKSLVRTLKMVFTHFVLLLLMTYLTDFRELSRLMLVYYLILLLFFIVLYKIGVLQALKYLRRRGINHRVVGIVGFNQNAIDLYKMLSSDVSFGYRILGYYTDESSETTEGAKIRGKLDDIHEAIERGRVEEVYIAVTTTNSSRVKRIIRNCERNAVRVKIIPNFQSYMASHAVDINYYSHIPVLSIRKEPLAGLPNKIIKRSFDVVFSTFVLLGLCSWILPIACLFIAMDSKGKVLFKQKRSGLNGKTFTCYKLRTMFQNTTSDKIGTQKNDVRVTKVGKFLRRSRIDELPQFYNVLIGQMSVVGPRPHMIIHTQVYSELIDKFMIRHYVKPGITGWAQTVGELDADQKLKEMKEKIKNDIWYIENWSFLLDIKIIVQTILNIFKKDIKAK